MPRTLRGPSKQGIKHTMANLLSEGTWPATVIDGGVGEELDKANQPTGRIKARVNVKFDDGPNKGRTATYEDTIDARSSIYIMRSLKAIGWRGPGLDTVETDIAAWVAKTGGKTTAEVKHIEIKKGARYEKWVEKGNPGYPIWDKVSSLGRGPRELAKPSTDALSDANDAMRRAMEADGASEPDYIEPAGDPNDIPFATCSTVSLGEIAKVLR
jgi:hypothetical protein